MYKIKVISNFSAAHSLREYKGKCESLHGHNWKVEVIISSRELDRAGMVIDFGELKIIVNRVLEKLDHKHLNWNIFLFLTEETLTPAAKKFPAIYLKN